MEKKGIVEKSYPYRFALQCTVIFLCGALLTSAIIWQYSYSEPAASYAESYRILKHLKREIAVSSIIVYAFTSLFTIGGTAIISLLYSHKVAGPLYKLTVFLRRAASGDFNGSAVLRRTDVIHPLAEEVNTLISSYRALIAELETRAESLGSAVRPLAGISRETASPGELRKMAAHISAKADEIGELMGKFRLKNGQ